MAEINIPTIKTQATPNVPKKQETKSIPDTGQTSPNKSPDEKKIEVEEEEEDQTTEKETETTEGEEEPKEKDDEGMNDDDMASKATSTGMQVAYLIVCLIIALIKDIIEIILVLTGVGNVIVIFISVPFTIILALLLGMAGRRSNFNSLKSSWQSIL